MPTVVGPIGPFTLRLRSAHTEKARLLKPFWHDKLIKKGTKGVLRALGTFFKE